MPCPTRRDGRRGTGVAYAVRDMAFVASPPNAPVERHSVLDVRALKARPVLIYNPRAGQKLGLSTNAGTGPAVEGALLGAGAEFEPRATESAGHATELAREAVREGRELVIAAGGDGTLGEVAQALVGSDTVLGVMPLGSIMNVARMLHIPRDLPGAALTIMEGRVLAADMGRAGDQYFFEAAGVGLDAGLYGYFDRLESGARPAGVLRAMLRFLRMLGRPRLTISADGVNQVVRAPMVAVANGPYVGAAYAVAPGARIDDGLLDVVVFRGTGVLRILVHLAAVAGGRHLPPPPQAETLRVPAVRIGTRRRRPLPVHADGTAIGATPARFEAIPAALKVIVGQPPPGALCAWTLQTPCEVPATP